MSSEFTGERVVPGQVDVDLWNEHVARYAFAARIASGCSVLDIGSGTGYGTAELALHASRCVGVDASADAILHAQTHYALTNVDWARASATDMPFRDGVFDLVVCFEVIEHLREWPQLLREARRVLSPRGQLIVSTPNRSFYAEARKLSGPNPFHVHEFDYQEFADALREVFPHVSIFVEDHTQGVLFRSILPSRQADAQIVRVDAQPEHSNFYVAICALEPQAAPSNFVYLPSDANLLRERALHIERLQTEITLKEKWIAEARAERDQLHSLLRLKEDDLAQRTEWAEKLNSELDAAMKSVERLQQELEAEQAASREVVDGYERKVSELESEVEARSRWALDTEQRLTGELDVRSNELIKCNELLQEAEHTIEERTAWAQSLDRERETLSAQVNGMRASRWMKLGRLVGLGPELPKQ